MKILDLSVVIPTLGGPQLRETLMYLNSGEIIPAEIIIAIPAAEVNRVSEYKEIYANISVLQTNCRGQVAQRAEGFLAARFPFVLQIDDDVHVSHKCILELLICLQTIGHNAVVGPVLVNQSTQESLSNFPVGIKRKIADLYLSTVWELPRGIVRMGKYSALGMAISVDPKYCDGKIKATDWLPGGCVMGYREKLICDNFYPWSGKAYAEDLLHSFYRTKNKIQHFVVLSATAAIEKPQPINSFEFYKMFKTRIEVGKMLGASKYKLYFALIFDQILRSFLKMYRIGWSYIVTCFLR